MNYDDINHIFSIGDCKKCGKYSALLNNKCTQCNIDSHYKNDDIPDFLKDIFTKKDNDD